jgi:hypothetical protein
MGQEDEARHGPDDRRINDLQCQKEILGAISDLKMQFGISVEELRSVRLEAARTSDSVNALTRDMNGRFKKLEHVVFGDEDGGKIGLSEKVRRYDQFHADLAGDAQGGVLPMPERVRNLESGWMKLTAISVFACSLAVKGVELAWHSIFAVLASGKTR